MKTIYLILFLVVTLSSCEQKRWINTDNGVIIRLQGNDSKGTKTLRISVVNDRIFHVLASPSEEITESRSLSVISDQSGKQGYTVTESDDSLTISAKKIKAVVSLSSGQIQFRDLNNRLLLKESTTKERTFNPIEVEGTKGFSMRQVFESTPDEAFYGLGQHQSDEFNYKGRNESLYQYNTKVSVPFIISNHNYGILWDNYSLTRFGDPRDYSQLSLLNLYDDEGNPGGLTATYLSERTPDKKLFKRQESSIDYENNKTVRNFPEGFPLDRSTVTWTGKIEPKESGLYHFKLYYAGYVKLYLDDELIVPERWRTAWNPNTYKFNLNLDKARKYSIRLEWKPDGGVSYIGLKLLNPAGSDDQGDLSLWSEMGDNIDYYFISGDNFDDIISGYRCLTGKAPIMPKWAMGFWQSRERYKSQDQLISIVKEYRKRQIPLDNIVLDWSYWPVDQWGSHEFDKKFFPDPAGMTDSVHKLNARIMISVWPKFYINTEHFREFDSKGWMYRQAIKDSVRDWIGKGYIGSFYDAYRPEARDLFWNQIREHLYTKGFDAWWMDASEPDILSNSDIDYRKKLTTPTALGPSTKYFNAYALMNAMTIYNGQRSVDPDKRVFLLTRSGFLGLQRYSTATWSGDIATRWEDLKAQIPAGLNYSMSGIPYWTFDIGGFCVENRYTRAKEGTPDMDEWRELNTRWFQFGSFCPLFRSHGQYPYREIFNIAPEGSPAYNSMVYYDKLRYRLMPYTYTLAGLSFFNDYTIMRAMVMDFPYDKNVENIGDQYMFGPSILVAPVYRYKATNREVYLPSEGGWYDLYTGKHFTGGQRLNASAPLERMPLFIREGSIIPVGPDIQYTDQKPADPITLFVYTGRNCAFTLYEDEGINYNYEKGSCSTIKFSFNNATGELTLGDRYGGFNGMLKSRIFRIIWVTGERPVSFDPDAQPDAEVIYYGSRMGIKMNFADGK